MKRLTLTVVIVLSLILSVGAFAEETKSVNVGNKICPVSGEKVGEMGDIVTYEHEGKVYNLCCKMCEKDFKKDPEKFINKVNEELKAEATQKVQN